jgi:quercetin dioxygenase-like cupin family protein
MIMLVEVPPQVNTGLHTHPGFDAAYLIEGDLTRGSLTFWSP